VTSSLRCYPKSTRTKVPSGIYPRPSLHERFVKHIRGAADGCIVWVGHRLPTGYGLMTIRVQSGVYRRRYAHRMAWELFVGQIPPGLFVLHRCDNPPCVKPEHLFLGTQADNLQDASSKGRLNGRPGMPRPRKCKRHGVLSHGCGSARICRHGVLTHGCGADFHRGRKRSMETREKISAAAWRRYHPTESMGLSGHLMVVPKERP
jgi:hypothetical protein